MQTPTLGQGVTAPTFDRFRGQLRAVVATVEGVALCYSPHDEHYYLFRHRDRYDFVRGIYRDGEEAAVDARAWQERLAAYRHHTQRAVETRKELDDLAIKVSGATWALERDSWKKDYCHIADLGDTVRAIATEAYRKQCELTEIREGNARQFPKGEPDFWKRDGEKQLT